MNVDQQDKSLLEPFLLGANRSTGSEEYEPKTSPGSTSSLTFTLIHSFYCYNLPSNFY